MTTPPIAPALRELALATKGFMPADEGDALYAAAVEAGRAVPGAPWVEVGSYCGRSTIWLGAAARGCHTTLFAVDHHRGSEENQAGWEHHDTTTVDPEFGLMDTLGFFRKTIARGALERHVVAVVGESTVVARHWGTPLALLFIDGGHGVQPARDDFAGWVKWVQPGGLLVIHDVFPDPADGGRPPYEEIYLPALASDAFTEVEALGSMRVLERTSGAAGRL